MSKPAQSKEQRQRTIVLALVHLGLALAFFGGFFWVMS